MMHSADVRDSDPSRGCLLYPMLINMRKESLHVFIDLVRVKSEYRIVGLATMSLC